MVLLHNDFWNHVIKIDVPYDISTKAYNEYIYDIVNKKKTQKCFDFKSNYLALAARPHHTTKTQYLFEKTKSVKVRSC